jgi:hypothetical protein
MLFVTPAKKGERDAYQLAILWHAASSMGPPCVRNAGPRAEINSVNNVGYGNRDNSTRDLCIALGHKVIEVVKNGSPVCSHVWRNGLSSG